MGDEWLLSRNGTFQARQAVSLRTQTQPGPSPAWGLMLKAITLSPREIPQLPPRQAVRLGLSLSPLYI